jgi:hypothetical protein
MNEAMRTAWLELSQMLGGQATQDDLTVFLRTWTWAIKAEREECAKVCEAAAQQMDDEGEGPTGCISWVTGCAAAIRKRGQP